MFGPNPLDEVYVGPPVDCGPKITEEDLYGLIPALTRAEMALRIAAVARPGVEGHHLTGLADALSAQLRIERPRVTSTKTPAA